LFPAIDGLTIFLSFESQKQLDVRVWIVQSEASITIEAVVPSKDPPVVSGGLVETEDLNHKKE
jgi:hypothetical protein